MIWAEVGTEPIDPAVVLARVGRPEDGAVTLFLGTVRNHSEGRAVTGITYEAYLPMATAVLREIATEAAARHGTGRIAVTHRVGALAVGEVSVAIATSTPHRAEGYAASREVIEQIKQRLPVWKHEHRADGHSTWVAGEVPAASEAP